MYTALRNFIFFDLLADNDILVRIEAFQYFFENLQQRAHLDAR